jgi:hypothetical protein
VNLVSRHSLDADMTAEAHTAPHDLIHTEHFECIYRSFYQPEHFFATCMDENSSWKAISRLASQEIPRLLWKSKVHYNSRNSLSCAWPWRICTAVQTRHGITLQWVRWNLISFCTIFLKALTEHWLLLKKHVIWSRHSTWTATAGETLIYVAYQI